MNLPQVATCLDRLRARRPGTRGVRLGAIEAEEARGPLGQWESERDLYAGRVLVVDGPEFERARERGRRLSLERAVEEALGGTSV